LEREISGYETVKFPPRPPELDEDYNRRLEEGKRKRKLKLKGLLDENGNPITKKGSEEEKKSAV
jgi:hypothetical protein